MRRLVITGAARRVGTVLSRGLQGVAGEMRLVDVVPVSMVQGKGSWSRPISGKWTRPSTHSRAL